MKQPFYEKEFDVKEYVSKRILEMDSLSDRKLYQEMAENFLLPLFEMQREESRNLTKRVLDEVRLSDDCYNIAIGLTEREKFAGTDDYLHPILQNEPSEIIVADMNEALADGQTYHIENIFLKDSYPSIELFLQQQTFAGRITTTEGEYTAAFIVVQDTRYIDKLKDLYKAFGSNGAKWHPVILSYLIRTFSVSVRHVDNGEVKGNFIGFTVDFGTFENRMVRDILPLWNIKELTQKTSSFPISVDEGLKYEHSVLLEEKDDSSSIIVGNLDTNLYAVAVHGEEISIICSDKDPKEWLFYEVCENTKETTYQFPVLSNDRKQSLTDNLHTKYHSTTQTKAELYRVVEQSPFSGQVKLLGFEIPDSYSQTPQTYDMNQFYTDEVELVGTKKVLCLTFEATNKEDYLLYDYMSYITTIMGESFPHYHVVGELVGV